MPEITVWAGAGWDTDADGPAPSGRALSRIGTLSSASYVFVPGFHGSNLAVCVIALDDPALQSLVTSYDFMFEANGGDVPVPPAPFPLQAEMVGYGARAGSGIVAEGQGLHRTARIELSNRTFEVMITEQCLTHVTGGAYVLDTPVDGQGPRLCAFGGDLGAALMHQSVDDGRWYVLGVGS